MENSPLPSFPEFANLEPHHQATINQIVGAYPPYSDYNFVSLWSWDHQNKLKLSVLNSNLVIRFQDYSEPDDYFYSFFGSNLPDATARTLLEHSKQEAKPELKLIPELVINSLQHHQNFIITEDRDSFDYIIATKDAAKLYNSPSKRRHFNHFMNKHGHHLGIHELDISSTDSCKQILSVFDEWTKSVGPEGQFNEGELAAVKKLLNEHSTIDTTNLHVVGLSLGGDLSAFSIAEVLSDGFAMGHYAKTTKRHRGMGVALDSLMAKSLINKGVNHWNHEQDLGIEGLRQSKMDKQPVYFLKKFNMSMKD